MKKYISIFLLVAAAVLGTACSNDNNELPEYAAGLKVVKAQTAFNVIGGENEVKMASEPAQAYAQDAWLTVTKKAETLLLTATTNTSPQTRNTLLVIKDAKGDSITLNVQQEGITFGLPAGQDIFTDDKAVQKTMIATANVPVTYTTTGDWLSVAEQGSELTVKATENTTGKARVGWVIAKAAGLVDSLRWCRLHWLTSLANISRRRRCVMLTVHCLREPLTSVSRLLATIRRTSSLITNTRGQ